MSDDTKTIAVHCDYENLAIGANDAKYGNLDIQLILERLLDKGNVVIKRAYADWVRYKGARRGLHEAGFELVEVPHVSYSGKNSADIRLVVDALDLCYTKPHVDTFVIASGDSDFSPLVSKLRENNKTVIAVGVKNSSSDLLIESVDEFIYYDDLYRKAQQPKSKGGKHDPAIDLVVATVESLSRDRDGHLWSSMIKQTIKRKQPNFSESYHGYRSFNELMEEAERRGLLKLQKDQKSGGYIVTPVGK